MSELELVPLLSAVWEELGVWGFIAVVFAIGCMICWVRGKPLIAMFTGNGYIRQKDYDEDQRVIREERAATRDKLDAVAKDLNELVGYVKGRSSK